MTPKERADILRQIAKEHDRLRVTYISMAMWTEDGNQQSADICLKTIREANQRIVELQAEVYL